MGFIPVGGASAATYITVTQGVYRQYIGKGANREIVEWGGYTGVITGVRLKHDDFDGEESEILQIRMQGTDYRGNPQTVILCGRAIFQENRTTVYARALLAALCNPDNAIAEGTEISISVWEGNKKATNVKVLYADMDPQGSGLPKLERSEDHDEAFKQVNAWIKELKVRFGTFGKDADDEGGYGEESDLDTGAAGIDASHGAATAAMKTLNQSADDKNAKHNKFGIDPNYFVEYGIDAPKEKQIENKSPFLRHNGKMLKDFTEAERTAMLTLLDKNGLLPELAAVLINYDLPF